MSVPEKHRDVARAWVDGADIEMSVSMDAQEWAVVDHPRFSECCEYRVKPKAKIKKWRWVCKLANCDGLFITNQYHSEQEMRGGSGIQKMDATMIEVDE